MGGFLILSAFIQLPVQMYILDNLRKAHSTTLQLIVQGLAASFLFLETILGYMTIRRITEVKAQQFHVKMIIQRNGQHLNANTMEK